MPDVQWGQTNQNVRVWSRALQKEQVAHAPQNPELPKGVSKAFLKARWGRGTPGYVISSCTILWLVDVEVTGRLTSSVLRCQYVGGLWAHDHQVVNFFYLMVVFSIWKTQEICMRYYLWVLQRGTTAKDMGEESVPGRPPRVLLRYHNN